MLATLPIKAYKKSYLRPVYESLTVIEFKAAGVECLAIFLNNGKNRKIRLVEWNA